MKLVLIALAAVMCSCSTFKSIESKIDYVAPAAYLVASQVYERAISDEDRVDKAILIDNVTDKLAAYVPDHKPTREEFLVLIAEALPQKPHWQTMSFLIADLYVKYTANIKDDDVESITKVIRAISEGLNQASNQYIP